MNEPSANSFFVVLLFIIRCVVPLAILFGISYLLRKMGLVAIESPEPKDEEKAVEKSPKDLAKTALSPKLTGDTQPKKLQKRKVAPSRKKPVGKKPATKTKTGNLRSRSNDNA